MLRLQYILSIVVSYILYVLYKTVMLPQFHTFVSYCLRDHNQWLTVSYYCYGEKLLQHWLAWRVTVVYLPPMYKAGK